MRTVTTASTVPASTTGAHRSLDSYGVADLLGVKVGTVRSWRKRGLGPPWYKFEGIVRYRLEDVVVYRDGARQETLR